MIVVGTDHDHLIGPLRIAASEPPDDVIGLDTERLDLRIEPNAEFVVAEPAENVLALEDLDRRDSQGMGRIPALRDTDARNGDEYGFGALLARDRRLAARRGIDVRPVGIEVLRGTSPQHSDSDRFAVRGELVVVLSAQPKARVDSGAPEGAAAREVEGEPLLVEFQLSDTPCRLEHQAAVGRDGDRGCELEGLQIPRGARRLEAVCLHVSGDVGRSAVGAGLARLAPREFVTRQVADMGQ